MNNKRAVIVIAVITFIVGILVGYFSLGKKEERKNDAKQLLSRAIQEIEAIENENKNLKSDLERVNKDKLTKENQSLKEQLKTAQQDNEKLENEIIELKAQLTQTETIVKTGEDLNILNDNLKNQVSELEKENQDLKLVIEKINSLTKQQEPEMPGQRQE